MASSAPHLEGSLASGGEAAAHVAYGLSELVLVQPLGEDAQCGALGAIAVQWSARGRANGAGRAPRVLALQRADCSGAQLADHFAGPVAAAAPQPQHDDEDASSSVGGGDGAPGAASVLSGSGVLLRMLPSLHKLAAARRPVVLHVAALRLAPGRTALETDLSEVTALRESGCGIVCASTVQEVHDLGLVAHLCALKLSQPFVSFFDGARLAGELSRARLLPFEQMRALAASVGVVKAGASAAQLADVVDAEMAAAAAALGGRRYRPFEYEGPEDAEAVVVAMGTAARAMVEAVRHRVAKVGSVGKVGVLRVLLLRPWSARHLLAALPATARRICVVDQNRSGDNDTPLFKDVVAALHAEAPLQMPLLLSANLVVSSKTGLVPAVTRAVLDNLAEHKPRLRVTTAQLLSANAVLGGVRHGSELARQTVSWTLGEPRGREQARAALAVVLGPFLGLHVQHHEEQSIKTGLSRVDLRYSPADIAAPYVVAGADAIAVDDLGVLLLPHADALAQARAGTKLLVNAGWADAAAAEADLGAALLHRMHVQGVELWVMDATKLARHASNWAVQCALAKLCEGPGSEYRQVFTHLGELIRANVPGAHAFCDELADKKILKHVHKIDLSGFSRHAQQQGRPHSLSSAAGSASGNGSASAGGDAGGHEMGCIGIDFVPQDMFPAGVLTLATGGSATSSSHQDAEMGSANSSKAYFALLEQLFGERLVVADTTGEPVPAALEHSGDSAKASLEMCFGKYLVKAQARRRLVDFVARLLAAPAAQELSKELLALLGMWHGVHDNAVRCGKVVPRLTELLAEERGKSAMVAYVHDNRALLHKTTKWIVGGSNWAYDLSNSGIRHIITSGEDVNVLILDSEAYQGASASEFDPKNPPVAEKKHGHGHGAADDVEVDLNTSAMSVLSHSRHHNKAGPAASEQPSTASAAAPAAPQQQHAHQPQQPGRRKKDIGLYAMNYGTAFVASISALASHSQAMRALSEADAFRGPSIVLAHAPPVRLEADVEAAAAAALAAVDSGAWPLYRWNPALEKDEFALDSAKLKLEIQEFLKKEHNLSMLANARPALPEPLQDHSLEADRAQRAEQLHKRAVQRRINEQFDSLVDGAAGGAGAAGSGGNPQLNLLVLFGSDSGRGAGVAEKLAKKAQFSGCGEVRCLEAKEFSVDKLAEETLVLLVLSTAGQGEPCANAKAFSNELLKSSAKLPGLRFAVFGLGDSHYWGAKTAESARYFCLNARDLDTKLAALGAERVVACGLGDDQHDDGFEGALVPWEEELWAALGVTIKGGAVPGPPAIVDDDIKIKSRYLRGMIDEGLADLSTGKLLPEDCKLTKFHGIYQQDLRTVREELDAKGLERAYSFMIRIGVPGGVATSEQYIAMDDLCSRYANGALKITTRQAFQFHGVVKKNLKTTMRGINRAAMDTLAACGDVNRNIIANPHHRNSQLHRDVNRLAIDMQAHLRPRTTAYAEIWLDQKPVAGSVDHEPMYGETYLPRKFKIAMAIPPLNDVDVFSHCLGFIAIGQNDRLVGYNVAVGGGLGTTHGNKQTYPRLSDLMGFCTPEQALKVAEAVVVVQRDHGERENRKHARLKYTVEDMGVELFRQKVEHYCGFKLGKPVPFKFNTNADPYGWSQSPDGRWQFTLFVENGYIKDSPQLKIKTALREIAEYHSGGEMNLTATQNIIIADISPERKPHIEALLAKYGLDNTKYSGMRLHSMACVAMPTCALAMAESQTYLPSLIDKIEVILDRNGLRHDAITIRMTGCPNGCGRPTMAEIGFIGKAMGVYNMYLGGGFAGQRISKMFREGVNEQQILELLEPMLRDYAQLRHDGEHFGDFCIRHGVIEPTMDGKSFWNTGADNIMPTKDRGLNIYW